MYALVTRRAMNPARMEETLRLAQTEFFPTLRHAPGFVSFTLVQGEEGVNTVVTVFESKAQAEAFRSEAERWGRVLEEHGHQVASRGGGEVAQHFEATS